MALASLARLFYVFLLSACGTQNIASGMIVEKNHQVKEFKSITVSGCFDCTFVVSDSYSVVVKTDETIHPLIEIKNVDQCLSISQKKNTSFNTKDPITIIIKAPSIEQAFLSGASSLTMPKITQSSLKFNASGASTINAADCAIEVLTITLSGSSRATVQSTNTLHATVSGASKIGYKGIINDATIQSSGACAIDGSDAKIKRLTLDVTGASSAEVNVNELLQVTASGSSSIVYTGSAVVKKQISGASRIKSR